MSARRTRLRTVGNIKTELAKVYRFAMAGEMDWQDARAAAAVLRELRHLLEASDVDQRLARLEEAAEDPFAAEPTRPTPRQANASH